MHKFSASCAMALFVFISGTATPALADSGDWFGCTHPEWKETFGVTHLLVSSEAIEQLGQGPGVTCDPLGNDYESSRGRACVLADSVSSNAWAVFNLETSSLDPLNC